MNKKYFVFIWLFAFISLAYAQNFGIAVEDSGFAARVNPAALGFGNASGVAFYQEFDKDGLLDTRSLYLNFRNFSYGLDSVEGDFFNNISLGFKVVDGLAIGASGRWAWNYDGVDFGLSSVVRPLPFFSFGIKTTDVRGSVSDISMGLGLRPLVFNEYWGNRLTLYVDTQASDILSPLAYGAIFEPVDGIRIRGDFDYGRRIFSAGIAFNTRFLSAGVNSQIRDNSFQRGNFSLFASERRMRTVAPAAEKKIVSYGRANIITDFPVDQTFIDRHIGRNRGISLLEFINDMEMIKNDPDIHAVLFKNQRFNTSFANIIEISRVLSEVRAAGKRIYFYFETASLMQYALAASVADKIYIAPGGSINLRGFSRTGLYFRNFLDRLGIRFYNFRSHDYKTGFNMLTEPGMTQEEREAFESLFSSLQEELELLIYSGRGARLRGSLEEIIAGGPYFSSRRALEAGLIDGRLHSSEFHRLISKNKYAIRDFSAIPQFVNYDWGNMLPPNVAVIYVTGNIVRGTGIKGENAGAASVARAISDARNNPSIKAIILRIDSGGGSALASDIIAHEVMLSREGDNAKPVIVSMGGVAASGGYYIAAGAKKIFAAPVTITGSIGVIAIFPDISRALEKLDITSETVKTSESGDFGNFTRPMTEREIEKIREYIAESYEQFVTFVSKGRKIPFEDVDKIARGRIWTGRQAKEISLIDSIGGLSDAISHVERKYLRGQRARIVEIVPGSRFFSLSSMFGLDFASRMKDMPEIMQTLFDFFRKADSFEEGVPLYLMPYTLEELGLLNNRF
ncbi:MAG: signal peptide peptidase SppA [Spirochaetes bacterium]|nr:signal peptide peptidase SppA [Spirochaetota bacterium]